MRDKLLMAASVAAYGLRSPDTVLLSEDVGADLTRGPVRRLIAKPRTGTARNGVRIVEAGEGRRPGLVADGSLIVQQFISAPILHVDGWFDGRELGVWSASRYLGTCLDYESGAVLGSVEIDEPHLASRLEVFTTGVLRALSTGPPRVFHAEVLDLSDEGFCLLEIGGRVGGAEIAQLWREVHGIDLVAVACALQCGVGVPDAGAGPRWPGAEPAPEVRRLVTRAP